MCKAPFAATMISMLLGLCTAMCSSAHSGDPLLVTQPNALLDGCGGVCQPADCCDNWCACDRRFGLLPSDHCFDGFISPLSNPFFFEDPRSLTEVRGIFLDNSLPAAIGGGDAQVWAAQLRGQFSERWSVIAPRLGHLQVNQPGGGAPAGFPSAPIGLKYNLIRDVASQLLVSGGLTYFIPGSPQAFSNLGDGDFHLFLTGGTEILGLGHWLSGTGFRLPADNTWGTQLWYWSNQWDVEVVSQWYAIGGVNWFHWMSSSGAGFTGPITSIDLINLPSGGVAGSNVVSGVAGVKWKPRGHLEVAAGYEFPLSENADILRNRLYVDMIVRY